MLDRVAKEFGHDQLASLDETAQVPGQQRAFDEAAGGWDVVQCAGQAPDVRGPRLRAGSSSHAGLGSVQVLGAGGLTIRVQQS